MIPDAFTLPLCFQPRDQHVIIGRGRTVKQSPGNLQFAKVIQDIAPDYRKAVCKADKATVLTKLVHLVYSQAPDAGFVKKDKVTGRWSTVDEALARATASQALRNYLSDTYRSSQQFRRQQRLQRILGEQVQPNRPERSGSKGTARCVSPIDTREWSNNTQEAISMSDADVFDLLLDAFGNNYSSDPFTPTPLRQHASKANTKDKLTTKSPLRRTNSITPATSYENLAGRFLNTLVLKGHLRQY